jgi:hypothetical protein
MFHEEYKLEAVYFSSITLGQFACRLVQTMISCRIQELILSAKNPNAKREFTHFITQISSTPTHTTYPPRGWQGMAGDGLGVECPTYLNRWSHTMAAKASQYLMPGKKYSSAAILSSVGLHREKCPIISEAPQPCALTLHLTLPLFKEMQCHKPKECRPRQNVFGPKPSRRMTGHNVTGQEVQWTAWPSAGREAALVVAESGNRSVTSVKLYLDYFSLCIISPTN